MTGTIAGIVCGCLLGGGVLATEPPPAPFDWALGHWHGTRTAADDGSMAPMSLLVEGLPGGAGQIERLEVETDGDPYVGFVVRLPDRDTGAWTMVYANDARMKFARLVAAFESDRVVWNSITAKPPRGSRLIAERLGPDHWRRTQEFTRDPSRRLMEKGRS